VLEQASWAEDDIVVEYLGGVLAGARTDDHRDDRAVVQTALISRLSSYALRLHYLVYAGIGHHGRGQRLLRLGDATDRLSIGVAAPYPILAEVFGDDPRGVWPKVQHAGRALVREGLLSTDLSLWGTPDVVPGWARTGDDDLDAVKARMLAGDIDAGVRASAFVGGATMDGAELFLWGRGEPDRPLDHLFAPDFGPHDDVPGVEATVPHPALAAARAAADGA
jgi:hypothetical protein